MKWNEKRKKETSLFLRQFATLITSGISVLDACECMRGTQKNLSLQKSLIQMRAILFAGFPLSEALKRTNLLDELSCHLIHVGEESGKLDIILEQIASQYEQSLVIHRQIKQAIFYPIFILFAAFLMVNIMFLFIIPTFSDMFSQLNTPIPYYTQLIFFIASIYRTILIITSLIIIATCVIFYKKQSQLISTLRGLIHYFPFIYAYFYLIALAQFSRLLALTYSAGITINDSLKLLGKTLSNSHISTTIYQTHGDINTGHSLYYALSKTNKLPPFFLELVKVGEETGKLDIMLIKAATLIESDIQQIMQHLLAILEPLIILILGVLIGGLVIAMYLPIFNLGNTI